MFKNLKIGIKILLVLSFVAIVAVGVIGYISYQAGKTTLEEAAYSKLRAVREIKKNQLQDYFKIMEAELNVLKDNSLLVRALQEFNNALNQSERKFMTPEWELLATRYSKKMHEFLKHFGWYDLLLINLQGDIVYTVARESDLGMNIPNSELHTTSLANAFRNVKSLPGNEFSFADFQPYFPSAGIPAAFIMTQMIDSNGDLKGYMALQIPLDKINHIMRQRAGLGKTGETYLVGPDYRMRSDSFLDKEGHSVSASFAGSVEKNGINTAASRKALAGFTGENVIEDYRGVSVLSSYTFLEINGLQWALIAEMDEAEAFERVEFFRNRIIIWFSFIILVIIVLAYYFGKTITSPIKDLTQRAQELAEGNLDVFIHTSRQDEIGVLASSFRYMQKSVKDLVEKQKKINSSLRNEIIERKKIEEALEREREKLYSVLDELPASVHLQAPDYTIRFANRYFRERFGEAENSFCYKVLHNKDEPCDICPSEKVLRTKKPGVYEDTHCDGRRYRIYNYPHVDTDGTPLALQLGIDITEQKQAEEALRESEHRFRILVNSMDDTVFTLDNEQCFLEIYGSLFEKLRIPANQSIGKKIDDIFDPKKIANHHQAVQQVRNGENVMYEWSTRLPEGTRHIQNSLSPILDSNNQVEGIVGVARDITPQKQFEKQLIKTEKLMTVAEMSAMISHEFRNSLTSVRMILELQHESGNLNPSELKSLSVALSSISHMESIVSQLLNFSRPNPISLKQENLNSIIEDSITLTNLQIQKKKITLTKNLDPSLPHLELDREHFKEALVNLILNAIQSISSSKKSITNRKIQITSKMHNLHETYTDLIAFDMSEQKQKDASWKRDEIILSKGAECALIQINDSGIGISATNLKRIFDPFFTTKTVGGTGLGLAMVKAIVNAHKGIIRVSSKLGEETVFSIYLPIKG